MLENVDNTWIHIVGSDGEVTCSYCEMKVKGVIYKESYARYRYCPNCGKRMNEKIVITNQYDYPQIRQKLVR